MNKEEEREGKLWVARGAFSGVEGREVGSRIGKREEGGVLQLL